MVLGFLIHYFKKFKHRFYLNKFLISSFDGFLDTIASEIGILCPVYLHILDLFRKYWNAHFMLYVAVSIKVTLFSSLLEFYNPAQKRDSLKSKRTFFYLQGKKKMVK